MVQNKNLIIILQKNMINRRLSIHYKSLFILILLLSYRCNVNGQIQLVDVKPSECNNSCDRSKRIYEEAWLNDSILQIQTVASSNCIGVYHPRLESHGSLLCLVFDDFLVDSIINPSTQKKTGLQKVASCTCVYQITWLIKGLNKGTNHILLLNGQLASDYSKKTLNELLNSYQIEYLRSDCAYLRNAIDKRGLKQGVHIIKASDVCTQKIYHEGIEQITVETP